MRALFLLNRSQRVLNAYELHQFRSQVSRPKTGCSGAPDRPGPVLVTKKKLKHTPIKTDINLSVEQIDDDKKGRSASPFSKAPPLVFYTDFGPVTLFGVSAVQDLPLCGMTGPPDFMRSETNAPCGGRMEPWAPGCRLAPEVASGSVWIRNSPVKLGETMKQRPPVLTDLEHPDIPD